MYYIDINKKVYFYFSRTRARHKREIPSKSHANKSDKTTIHEQAHGAPHHTKGISFMLFYAFFLLINVFSGGFLIDTLLPGIPTQFS